MKNLAISPSAKGLIATLALAMAAAGCSNEPPKPPADITLILAAYSAPREALENAVLPAFIADFRAKTGKTIQVQASYLASGAQTRAILGGFAADVALLAMTPDIEKLVAENLVDPTWANDPEHGIVASTAVAFAVRTGNPKTITNWADLAKPETVVLMPNPKTSGGAMWNITALWGAALFGHAGFPAQDQQASTNYLRGVLRNVAVLDKAARESLITFEKGVGDVAITYESEIVAGHLASRHYDKVLPQPTLLVEIPATVIHKNAQNHGVANEAKAFIEFLKSPTAQTALSKYGFRPPTGENVLPAESANPTPESSASVQRAADDLPNSHSQAPLTLFRINDLGGFKTVIPTVFGPQGVFKTTWESVYAE